MSTRTPLDDIEYLARSPHRVRVLETLAGERQTRRDVHETTDISQPTLGRVLAGFEDRGWVSRDGDEYALTPPGALLAEAFDTLHETVETVHHLDAVAPHLPVDEFDFDYRLFREATVTVPDPPDVFAHLRRGEELIRGARRVRWLGRIYTLDSLAKQRELVLEEGQHQEILLSGEAFDGLLSHAHAVETVRELLGTDRVSAYRYEGEIPFGLATADDVAAIMPYNEQNTPCALLDTENESIHEWVTGALTDYRERAEPVTVEDLPE